jgi:probable O-glycosylation ligase (exosortase A-associated)
MRELALIVIVAGICLVSLVNPRVGVLGYTWFALMRPDVLSWSVGKPFSLALAVCTLLGSLIHFREFTILFRNPISRYLMVLLIPITISADLAVDSSLSWPAWQCYIRIVIMALLIVVFVRTERSLRILVIVVALSLGFLGLKLSAYGFAVGTAQYMDDFGETMMSDNNMLALALAMTVPLCWYGRAMTNSRLIRLVLLGLSFGSIAGVVMTNSRGGALSLAAALALMGLRSGKRMATFALIVICTVPAVYITRHTYLARLSTITAKEDADESIRSRLNHTRAAYAMWKDYPFFGVGFGMLNYAHLAPKYLGYGDFHVAHNTYMQFLADDGIFAFSLYVGLLCGTLIWLERSARRAKRETLGREVYPVAIQTSLVSFAVGSYFLSRDSYDLLYIMLMAAAAWWTVQKTGAYDETDLNEEEPLAKSLDPAVVAVH